MQPAFVLHRWPYQEHSLIVELFSQRDGRIRVLAKGARRAKRGQAALLQPFRQLQVAFTGRSDLKTLTAVDSDDYQHLMTGNYLYCGFYINELLQRLLPEQASIPELFRDYQQTIALLRDQVAMEPVLRKFEWLLLSHLQLDFDWLQDVDEHSAIEPDQQYFFKSGEGFSKVLTGREPTPFFKGSAIIKMADFALQDADLLLQFKWVMRRALAPYLGNKPLRSRELFKSLGGKSNQQHNINGGE